MKKLISSVILILFLNSCSNFSSKQIVNLVNLTPKLAVETGRENMLIKESVNGSFIKEVQKYTSINYQSIVDPVIINGIIYGINRNGRISAFSLPDNRLLWCKDLNGLAIRNFNSGGILYNKGNLYITNGSRFLIILEAGTGNEIIRKEFPDILRHKPSIVDNKSVDNKLLILQTAGNQLFAYDIHNTRLVWVHEGWSETITTRNKMNPVIHNDHVLVSYSSGQIVYLNAKNGQEEWQFNLYSLTDSSLPNFDPATILTVPIVKGNEAYLATSNGKIIKIDLAQGRLIWTREAFDIQSMALYNGYLFVTNNARQVAAVSTQDGKVAWVGNLFALKNADSKLKPILSQPPYFSKMKDNSALIVAGSNGEIYQFTVDKNGMLPLYPEVKSIEKNIRYLILAGDNIYLFTNNKLIYNKWSGIAD